MVNARLVGAAILILIVIGALYYIGSSSNTISAIFATTTIHTTSTTTLTTASTSYTTSTTTVYVSSVAPVVIITSPENLSTVNGEVNITANVTDPKGIRSVQFYIGGNLSATVNSPPYRYEWNTEGLTKPEYTIVVKAYGNNNSSAQSQILVDIGLVQHGK